MFVCLSVLLVPSVRQVGMNRPVDGPMDVVGRAANEREVSPDGT